MMSAACAVSMRRCCPHQLPVQGAQCEFTRNGGQFSRSNAVARRGCMTTQLLSSLLFSEQSHYFQLLRNQVHHQKSRIYAPMPSPLSCSTHFFTRGSVWSSSLSSSSARPTNLASSSISACGSDAGVGILLNSVHADSRVCWGNAEGHMICDRCWERSRECQECHLRVLVLVLHAQKENVGHLAMCETHRHSQDAL